MTLALTFTQEEKRQLQVSLTGISINSMPRVGGREVMLRVCDPTQISRLSISILGGLVTCFENAKVLARNRAPLFDRCIKVIVKTLTTKICEQADPKKLDKKFSIVFCQKLIELADGSVAPEDYKYFRMPKPPKETAAGRTTIKSDILSSLSGDDLPDPDTLRQIHMTDRLGLLFLLLVSVKNTPYEYSIAKTKLQLGSGSKENKTNASHCGPLPQFQRKPRGIENAQASEAFLADMYLYLSLNRTNELPRSDNEVDMKLEPRMRDFVVEAMNEVAKGRLITSSFERVVTKIQRLVKDIKREWEGNANFAEKLAGLIEQEKGIDCVIDTTTGKVDPEFYRMNARILTAPKLKEKLSAHQWTQLNPSTQCKIIDALQKQILEHSSVPFLEKRSPSLLERLRATQI